MEGSVEITLVGADGGGGGFVGADSDGREGSAGGASGIRVMTSSGGCSSMDIVWASDPGSTRRSGEPIMVPVALVGVDRPWRISTATISGNSDRSIASGCQGCLTGWTWRFKRPFRTRMDGHTCLSVLFRRTFACKNFFINFFFNLLEGIR